MNDVSNRAVREFSEFLNSIEAVSEILRILNCRNIAAYLAKSLGEG